MSSLPMFLLVALTFCLVASSEEDNQLVALAQRIRMVRAEENHLLHQFMNQINPEENVEEDFAINLFKSRARRTTQDKVRACGSKLGLLVSKVCPAGCTIQSEWLQNGISTACCEKMCNTAEIMAGCCPGA